MKVLIFCFLAICGALAQEATTDVDVNVNVDTTATTDDATTDPATAKTSYVINKIGTLASSITPGILMGKGLGYLRDTVNVKGQVVNKSLEIGKDAITLGANVATQGFEGAKNVLTQGLSAATEIKTATADGVKGIVSKGIEIGDILTGKKISGLFAAKKSAAQAAINLGDNAATFGINLVGNLGAKGLDLGKTVAGKIGYGFSSGLTAAGNIDKAVNAKIVASANAAANWGSSLGVRFGDSIANAWRLSSKSQAVPTTPAPEQPASS